MPLIKTIESKMRETAPDLHRSLAASGKLKAALREARDALEDQVVSTYQAQRMAEKWDALGPMECARKMEMARSMAMEAALAELEFPQGQTSA